MNRLIRVELRRLVARRLALLVTLATIVIAGFVVFGLAQDSKPPSAAQQQRQQQNLKSAQQDWKANGAKQIKACRAEQVKERKSDPSADLGCDTMGPPTAADWGKPLPNATKLLPQGLQAASYLLAFASFLLGAGFVAAEFTTGAIGNWLTFEPRRLRVYGAKMIAAGIGVLPLALVVTVGISAGAYVISDVWGSVTLTGAQRDHLLWSGVRVLALAVAAAAIGAAFGALLRHTAAVIGVAMAYIVLIEGIFKFQLQRFQPWMITTNVDAWVQHGTGYYVQHCRTGSGGGYSCDSILKHMSLAHGMVYLLAVTVVLVALAAGVFRRRDVN